MRHPHKAASCIFVLNTMLVDILYYSLGVMSEYLTKVLKIYGPIIDVACSGWHLFSMLPHAHKAGRGCSFEAATVSRLLPAF